MTTKAQNIANARKAMTDKSYQWSVAKTPAEKTKAYEVFLAAVAVARAAELEPDEVPKPAAPQPWGTQAGDSFEHSYLPAGKANVLTAADMDKMRSAGMGAIRLPLLAMARSDLAGKISDSYMASMRSQVDMAIARFEFVQLDPQHHVNLWKGDKAHAKNYDAFKAGIANLTNAQYAEIAYQNWMQIGLAFRDYPLALNFDLLNEPHVNRTATGLTREETYAWYDRVNRGLRAQGGNNALRRIWLQPFGELRTLQAVIAKVGGNIGVSDHVYTPNGIGHGDALSVVPGDLTVYSGDIMDRKAVAARWGVPLHIGESGTSLVTGKTRIRRSDAMRAEVVQGIVKVWKRHAVPGNLWDYASGFALLDSKTRQWLPGMEEAFAGKLSVPDFPDPVPIDMTGGVLVHSLTPGVTFKDGVISFPAFPMPSPAPADGPWRQVIVVFPKAKLTLAARVLPDEDNPTGIKMEVLPYKANGKGGHVRAAGARTPAYRSASGTASVMSDLEAGAYVAVQIEQVVGSPAASLRLTGWSA